MDKLFQTKLSDQQPLSKKCIQINLSTFGDVCTYVQQLPYGRVSDKNNYSLILTEQKGTCSSKHFFLYGIAMENGISNLDLHIGIYKMNDKNTKGIGSVLKEFNLDYLPEAHVYLKHHQQILDFTREGSNNHSFEESLLYEEKILPFQSGDFKVELHQKFLKQWILSNKIPYSFNELWNIRETCIANLSQ